MRDEQNKVLLQKTWNELLRFINTWEGERIALLYDLKEAKEHVEMLSERERWRIKDLGLPPAEMAKSLETLKGEQERISGFGIKLPTEVNDIFLM